MRLLLPPNSNCLVRLSAQCQRDLYRGWGWSESAPSDAWCDDNHDCIIVPTIGNLGCTYGVLSPGSVTSQLAIYRRARNKVAAKMKRADVYPLVPKLPPINKAVREIEAPAEGGDWLALVPYISDCPSGSAPIVKIEADLTLPQLLFVYLLHKEGLRKVDCQLIPFKGPGLVIGPGKFELLDL